MRYATIDIGTNTILMLIADVNSDSSFSVCKDEHRIARLGEDLNKTGIIIDKAVERAKNILFQYNDIILQNNCSKLFAVGTSALRDAKNAVKVRNELEKVINSRIEIISGEQEALYSYNGAVDSSDKAAVIDIGGGSTEILIGTHSTIDERYSFQIGAVRLTETFFASHPPTQASIEQMRRFIQENIQELPRIGEDIIVHAVAGTPTTLAAVDLGLNEYVSEKIEGYKLNVNNIQNNLSKFLNNSIDDIIKKYSIHPKRADVITAGTIILQEVLRAISTKSCFVTTKGLRYGLMKKLIGKL